MDQDEESGQIAPPIPEYNSSSHRGLNSQPHPPSFASGLSLASFPSGVLSLTAIERLLRQQLQLATQTTVTEPDTNENAQLQLSIQIDRSYDAETTALRPNTTQSLLGGVGGGDTTTGSDSDSEEESAETTNNTTGMSNDSTRIELQVLTKWLENSIPFILLLLILFLYQHKNGMPVILLFSSSFSFSFSSPAHLPPSLLVNSFSCLLPSKKEYL
jgi:hypothetical protein